MRRRDAEANKDYCRKYYHRHRIAMRITKNLGIRLDLAKYMARCGFFPKTVERIKAKGRSEYP